MQFDHPDKIAKKCKHAIHPSSTRSTLWCPQCTIAAAQADLERAQMSFGAEGGPDAPAYMRDRAWNVARLRYLVQTSRFDKIMRHDCLRREQEKAWERAHQVGVPPNDDVSLEACVVCATIQKRGRPYAKPIMSLTTAWWEQEGALVDDQVHVPKSPPSLITTTRSLLRRRSKHPSYLRNLIQSYRDTKTVSDDQRKVWEERCKIARAVRRKYDLTDDFEFEPDFLDFPIPASHARYHHKQIKNDLYAGERRANRQKRRAENYKPSRSSLALSQLAEEVRLNEAELEKLRLEEAAAELRRSTDAVATEVGYLYLIGDGDLLEWWSEDIERSNLSLIYRKYEKGMEMVQMDEDHVVVAAAAAAAEGDEDEEL